ncbi:MAG: hypothetical protein KAI67_04505 [Candidatus Pacebacteria bacterium]|nr:hypothetical protein [Candidatus Paceibacterota bacterium]
MNVNDEAKEGNLKEARKRVSELEEIQDFYSVILVLRGLAKNLLFLSTKTEEEKAIWEKFYVFSKKLIELMGEEAPYHRSEFLKIPLILLDHADSRIRMNAVGIIEKVAKSHRVIL